MMCPVCKQDRGEEQLKTWIAGLFGRMPWRCSHCRSPVDACLSGEGSGSLNRTALSCPICSSHSPSDYSVIGYGSQGPGGVEYFAVLRCRKHGVEFADALPAPPAPEAAKSGLDSLYGDPNESSPRYIEFMDRIEAIVGHARGRLIHDVGCGNGHLLFEARRRGWRVQGSDIVPGVKDHVERNGIPCFIGNLSDLAIPSESCDVVTSFCVLPHHLAEPTPDMLTVIRILKVRGWFVCEFPDNGLYRRVGRSLYRVFGDSRPSRSVMANLYGPGGHQFAFTRDNLREYLVACGFRETIFQSYSGAPKYTLHRFRPKPFWYRTAAAVGVYGLRATSDIVGTPNHAVVFARKT
jgi:SAM-dependent methyltransferase